VPRSGADRASLAEGAAVTVAYALGGHLLFWRMRVDQVLPSSWYLVGVRAPAPDERRSFVRARLPLWLSISSADRPAEALQPADVDISAAGFSVAWSAPLAVGALVQVDFAHGPDTPPLQAACVVVRCDPRSDGWCIALSFAVLDSADEERLLHLVYRARERALAERLGRRRAVV